MEPDPTRQRADWITRVYVVHRDVVGTGALINFLLEQVAEAGGYLVDIKTHFTPEKNWLSAMVVYQLPFGRADPLPDLQDEQTEPIGLRYPTG